MYKFFHSNFCSFDTIDHNKIHFFGAPDSDIIKIHVFKGMSHVHIFG